MASVSQGRRDSTRPQLDSALWALADPTRRQVVDLLRVGPRRAGELAAATHMSAPAMSRHLRVLRHRGIVRARRLDEDARVRLFELQREPFVALRSWLDEVEQQWTDQLAAFKQFAEAHADD